MTSSTSVEFWKSSDQYREWVSTRSYSSLSNRL